MYAVTYMGLDMLTCSSSVYDRQVTVKTEDKNTLECMFEVYSFTRNSRDDQASTFSIVSLTLLTNE